MALHAIAIRGSERSTDGVNDWTTLYICVYHVEYIYIYIGIVRREAGWRAGRTSCRAALAPSIGAVLDPMNL
jgi:hypothetical protein